MEVLLTSVPPTESRSAAPKPPALPPAIEETNEAAPGVRRAVAAEKLCIAGGAATRAASQSEIPPARGSEKRVLLEKMLHRAASALRYLHDRPQKMRSLLHRLAAQLTA